MRGSIVDFLQLVVSPVEIGILAPTSTGIPHDMKEKVNLLIGHHFCTRCGALPSFWRRFILTITHIFQRIVSPVGKKIFRANYTRDSSFIVKYEKFIKLTSVFKTYLNICAKT